MTPSRPSNGPEVSVIIPAFNAAETLHEPLASLHAQTYGDWEAIIVDDGSTDDTLRLAERFAADDPRFRTLRQDNAGVSAARNAGLAAARGEWLLFLDADDTVAPEYLERMMAASAADDSLEAVYCGWASVSPDGQQVCTNLPKESGDLFETLAVDWRFAIHACVVRKALAEEVGGFETELVTSEDWDFWQRIARLGTRFGAVPEVLAFYRMRPGSASKQAHRMLADALRVLEQGQVPDPRVPRPHPVHPEGLAEEPEIVTLQRFYFLCFSAGLVAGTGGDAKPLLELLEDETFPNLDPYLTADWMVSAAMDASGRPVPEWGEAWRDAEPSAIDFLTALEAHAEAPGLASKASRTARLLVRARMARVSPLHLLAALPPKALLRLMYAKASVRRGVGEVGGHLRMWLTHGLRMMPRFYQRYRKVRQRYLQPESRSSLDKFFQQKADPWGYTSAYEQTKYEQTLDLVPEGSARVLEVGCAEGHFSAQLAPRVGSLLATDISQVAVDRAAERCAEHDNARFQTLDLSKDAIPGKFDAIVCSEVLYYLGRRKRLEAVAERFAEALEPGGQLVMAHANLTVDDPGRPGFDWSFNYGVKTIGETFAAESKLSFEEELQTPYYRVQRFERSDSPRRQAPAIHTAEYATPPADVEHHMVWNGVGDRLPILMYHRVADEGSEALAPYRVTVSAFEEQLRYLRDHGYRSIDLADWYQFVVFGGALPRGAVLITFDDGYRDFQDNAWPLLEQYGFSATVFLVAEKIGATNDWDAEYGETIELLGWRELRQLQAAGVSFGSHTATHPWLPSVSWRQAAREMRRSKQILEQGLGIPINALAYPWGAFNKPIQFLTGACGYEFGLSTAPGVCEASHSLLALPRLDIEGSDSLEAFVAKLEGGSPEPTEGAESQLLRAPTYA
ncbi:MAG: trifunctional glycosyltransferase/class I SAM-dependent methyltransferase/polysaccharide deacetylase [Acidobacteriota bacterium]